MDPFHEHLARVALDVAASYGFALAGGYAVQAHGFLDRPSADVDLFAEASAEFDFSEAVDAVITAYQRNGLEARAELAWFAEALEAVDRIPDAAFAAYGLTPTSASALRVRMHDWAKNISRD
jgi:hypothetical protein